MFDSSGNNITHVNATGQITLYLMPAEGLNGGEIEGNAACDACEALAYCAYSQDMNAVSSCFSDCGNSASSSQSDWYTCMEAISAS